MNGDDEVGEDYLDENGRIHLSAGTGRAFSKRLERRKISKQPVPGNMVRFDSMDAR